MNSSQSDSPGHLSHRSSPNISTKVVISFMARSKAHSSLASIFLLKVQSGLLKSTEVFLAASWCLGKDESEADESK